MSAGLPGRNRTRAGEPDAAPVCRTDAIDDDYNRDRAGRRPDYTLYIARGYRGEPLNKGWMTTNDGRAPV
jgi:hypothetical protein